MIGGIYPGATYPGGKFTDQQPVVSPLGAILASAKFENGVAGTAWTGTTPGDDTLTRQSSTLTQTYDSAQKAHGTLSLKTAVTAVGNAESMAYPASLVGAGTTFFRGYWRKNTTGARPNGLRLHSTGFFLRWHDTNMIGLVDGSGTNLGTNPPTGTYFANEWVRVEAKVEYTGSQTNFTVRLFRAANVGGSTPDDTLSYSYVSATAPARPIEFGGISDANATDTWWDSVAWATSGWIGPITVGYKAAVLADAPVAYWRLGEASGTTAVDVIAGANLTHSSTITGAASLLPAESDLSAVYTVATRSERATTPLTSTNNWTIEGWINLKSGSGAYQHVSFANGSNDTGVESGVNVAVHGTTGALHIGYPGIDNWQTGINLTFDAAHHIVVVRRAGTLEVYVDGVLHPATSWVYPAGAAPTATPVAPNKIVMADSLSVGSNPWFGRIDEVAFYNTPLTAARILAHYQAAGTFDWNGLDPWNGYDPWPSPHMRSPALVPGLTAWWRADAITGLVDGDPVAIWPDSSGAGANATQATSGARPLYKTNQINGLPVVRFDGVDDNLVSSAAAGETAQTVFVVSRVTASTTYRSLLGSNVNGGLQFRVDGAGTDRLELVKEGQAAISSGSGAIVEGAAEVYTASHVNDTSYAFYRNGAADGSGASAQALTVATTRTLGINGSNSGEFMLGDIAEVITYNSSLSAGDRAKVHSYLQDKYAVAVSDYVPLGGRVYGYFGDAYFGGAPQVGSVPAAGGGGGTNWIRSFSESIGTVDSLARITAAIRTRTENSPLTDAQIRSAGFLRPLAESETLTETLARIAALKRAPLDLAGISDITSRSSSGFRSATDLVGLSDLAARSAVVSRAATDLIGLSELTSRQFAAIRKPLDAGILTDLATYNLVAGGSSLSRSLSDTETLVDTLLRTSVASRSATDTLVLADIASRVSAAARALSDVEGTTDLVAKVAAAARAMTETLAVSDLVTRFSAEKRTAADTLALSDLMANRQTYLRAQADTEALTDLINAALGRYRTFTDTEALSDTPTRLVSLVRALAEVEALTDILARIQAAIRTRLDLAGLSDTATRTSTSFRSALDIEALSDTRTLASASKRSPADNVGVIDTVAKASTAFRAAVDNATISDTSAYVNVILISRTITDLLGLTDSRAWVSATKRTPLDLTGLSDLVGRTYASKRAISEAEGLTDTSARTGAFKRLPTDTEALSDVAVKVMTLKRAPADLVGLFDFAKPITALKRVVADTETLPDSSSRQVTYVRIRADQESLLEAVLSAQVSRRFVSDVEVLVDTLDGSVARVHSIIDNMIVLETVTSLVAASGAVTWYVWYPDTATWRPMPIYVWDPVTSDWVLGRSLTDSDYSGNWVSTV